MYPNAKRLMLTGQFNWTTDNIRAILIATGQYTPSVNHTSLLDVPAPARVAISDVLSGKVVNVNVVDANDLLYADVSGPEIGAVLLVAMGSTDATSWLICHLDEAIAGLPFASSAGAVQLTWNNGPDKIFAL